MTEPAKPFAILIASSEPTVFRHVLSPEIDVSVLLFDQQRGTCIFGNLRVTIAQQRQRVAVEIFDHAQAGNRPPSFDYIQGRAVAREENNARENIRRLGQELQLRRSEEHTSELQSPCNLV